MRTRPATTRPTTTRTAPALVLSTAFLTAIGACSRGGAEQRPESPGGAALRPGGASPPVPSVDDYLLVSPRGATAFDTPPTRPGPAGATGGVRLSRGFGFQPTGETRTVGGRRYVRILDGRWLAETEVTHVRPSRFAGAHWEGHLDARFGSDQRAPLDVGWTNVAGALLLASASPEPGAAARATLPRGFRVTLTGLCRDSLCPVSTGWVRASEVTRPARAPRPGAVGPRERWIDVDLSSQTLIAYEGDAPVFATLVATGIGGPGSPLATPVGVFRIRSKHTFVRMDNLEHTGVEPYAYDVPLTQYFNEGKALHAAPWHDHLGRPRSHGCINLSPADARWLFDFTSPSLAPGQADVAATSARPGTLVRVRGELPAPLASGLL